MKKCFLFFFLLPASLAIGQGETVVCVHGFMRKGGNMSAMVRAFEKEGCTVVNWTYPSREKTIEEHAEDLVKLLQEFDCPIYFVTHSMGGLIVRSALNHPDCPEGAKLGKAVLLAPPNQGSALARRLSRLGWIRKVLGEKSGKQLMTMRSFDCLGDFPDQMPVLVIAGKFDGKVSVEETCLRTPHFHESVPSPHFWIAHCPGAVKKAKRFILSQDRDGRSESPRF